MNLSKSIKKCFEKLDILLDMESLHLTRPHAIMMVGIPGSGKTFFAEKFAETFSAPYIDSLAIETRASDAKSAGELIALLLGEITKTKQTFVFEGNSDARIRRTEFGQWARNHGYQPLFIWVQADQATSLKRSLKMKTLSKNQFKEVIQGFSAPHPDEKPVVISGKHTFASQLKVVLEHLSRDNRPATAPTVTAPARASLVTQSSPNRSITVR